MHSLDTTAIPTQRPAADFAVDDARAQERSRWARRALDNHNIELQRASVDAGFRSYWRAGLGDSSWIVMDSPPHLEDVQPWLQAQRLLAQGGVRVPEVLARDVQHGFLLLEDLGAQTLRHAIDPRNADRWFARAIEQLLRLQRIAPPPQLRRFDEALLHRDAGLFEEWFLGRHLGITLDCAASESLQLSQRRLMDNALAQAQVLTHRDFMPRNLMPLDDGDLAVLDFQDIVTGPIAYDPASLFKDAFLGWPLQRVDGWLQQYRQRAAAAGLPVPDAETFQRDADWMGIQRHLKVLGIFARLHHRDGKSHYLADAGRFIDYLDDVLPRYPQLQSLSQLLEGTVKPAMLRLQTA